MNKFTKNLYNKIQKDLLNKIGSTDTNFLLDKFGRGGSFLNTICLLPIWFSNSFYDKKHNRSLYILGEANLKAWIGYTLYDYIRDGKIPKEKLVGMISIANIYTNDALSIFIDQADSKLKKIMIVNLFNKIDLFYINQCRQSEYSDFKSSCSVLHEKSIAAAISAILVIPDKLYKKSIKHTFDFFKFYFTARQLSDDLDDYKKDLKLKINTPVTLMAKKDLSGKDLNSFIRKEIDINFNKAIKSLHKIKNFDSELFGSKYVKSC